MRTQAEIIGAIEALEKDYWDDMGGRRKARLISLLPYHLAKRWLKLGTSEADWSLATADELRTRCQEDLEFAWEKALGHRGISAGIMADVMTDWVWLLCSDKEHQQMLSVPHENYGAPKLALAKQLLSMKIALSADDQSMAERMAKGEPCSPGCENGCGR